MRLHRATFSVLTLDVPNLYRSSLPGNCCLPASDDLKRAHMALSATSPSALAVPMVIQRCEIQRVAAALFGSTREARSFI